MRCVLACFPFLLLLPLLLFCWRRFLQQRLPLPSPQSVLHLAEELEVGGLGEFFFNRGGEGRRRPPCVCTVTGFDVEHVLWSCRWWGQVLYT
jgi:hypothetical protein